MKKEKRDVPLRTAYSQAGRLWQPKPSSLRAQAQLMRIETVETFVLVKVEPKLLREEQRERERCASRQSLEKKLSLQEALDLLQNVSSEINHVLTEDFSDEEVLANYLLEFSLGS
ncbi:hypothetical protein TNCV_1554361 [Trichonephila clavipes]|nr:hypothetical protein TNCV_1554361 [Trichonephila clavipes]